MALYQAGLVRDRLRQMHAELTAEDAVELVPLRTTGDRVQTRLLAEIGGKGLFTKELEEALLDRRIDLAVHSLKDMETHLPAGLEIGCVLPRDDPRDVLVLRSGAPLAELPPGARVGTASLRRTAQLLRLRPDLVIAPIRGNVDTRLDQLAAGEGGAPAANSVLTSAPPGSSWRRCRPRRLGGAAIPARPNCRARHRRTGRPANPARTRHR